MRIAWSLQHERLDDFEPVIRNLYEIAFATERSAKTIIFPSEKVFIESCHKDWSEAQEKIANEVIRLYDLKQEISDEFKEARKVQGHNDAKNTEHNKIISAIENRVKILRKLADAIAQRVFDNKVWMAKRFLLSTKLSKPDIEAIKGNLKAAKYLNAQNNENFWLIADLTTYIGVGDLIHRKYLEKGKFKWNLVELKVGKVNKILHELSESDDLKKEDIISKLEPHAIKQIKRMNKQKERRDNILNFINKGEGIDIRTGINLKLSPEDVHYTRYDNELIDLIEAATTSQVGLVIIDGCLALFASTLSDIDTFHYFYHFVCEDTNIEKDGSCMETNKHELPIMQNLLRHPYIKDIILNNLKAAYHTSLFSLPIENVLYDLLFGRMRILMYLNIEAFCALCTHYCITVEPLSKKDTRLHNSVDSIPMINNHGIKLTTSQGKSFVLGKGSLARIYFDLVRPTSLIESLITTYTLLP